MTASERLRALAAKTDDPFWASEVQQGWLIDVGNALPLIADVVEAAERIENMMWDDDDDPLDAEVFGLRMAAVGAGLTALREHLEGGDE